MTALNDEPYREPTPFERQLLDRLVDLSKASDDLRRQLASCRVRTIEEDKTGSIEIEVPGGRSKGSLSVLVDAVANDVDGALIEVILFASKGRVCELEIVSLDGSPILMMPSPAEFEVLEDRGEDSRA